LNTAATGGASASEAISRSDWVYRGFWMDIPTRKDRNLGYLYPRIDPMIPYGTKGFASETLDLH